MSVGKNLTFGGWLLTTSLLVVAPLAAANDLDVTMRMVEDSEDLTNSVTREIRKLGKKSRNRELTGCHSRLWMPVSASQICRHNRHVRNFSLMVTSKP